MLYAAPGIEEELGGLLGEFDDLRGQLSHGLDRPRPWSQPLRRQEKADAWASSVRIEGFMVGDSEALEMVAGKARAGKEQPEEMAFQCYAEAMEHVAALAVDPHFEWSRRVVQDLHFEACRFRPKHNPGLIRTTPIAVSAEGGGLAYVAPDADGLDRLMDELAESLAGQTPGTHIAVAAAMAHLNLVSIHPFEDGNGRISRIIQSLVLARDGLLAPEFGSIEPYLAANSRAYYEVLQKVQGGRFDPQRDASPWVEFCLKAHIDQARARLARLDQAAMRWSRLEEIVGGEGWHDRLVIALEQALHGGADRSSYAAEAEVSLPTASQDLRRLLDAGYLRQTGGGRSTAYRPTDRLRSALGS